MAFWTPESTCFEGYGGYSSSDRRTRDEDMMALTGRTVGSRRGIGDAEQCKKEKSSSLGHL